MKTQRTNNLSVMRGFISAQAAIVLAVITATAGVLAYEWHSAHSAHAKKEHHSAAAKHHHHKTHEAKTASVN